VATTVAGAILDILWQAGVKQAFGIPGVHNLAFWNALTDTRPEIRSVRHEQTTVYAADGLARSTGRLGVAITTTGPGAANTLGAFGEAAISNSAVLVLSSEAPIKFRKPGISRGVLHEMVDQSELFKPLAKKDNKNQPLAISVIDGESAIAAARYLVKELLAAPRGSGYLGVPADVLSQEISIADQVTDIGSNETTIEMSSDVKNLLNTSRKIGIWAGGGALDFSEDIAELSEHFAAPIFTSFAGRGVGSKSDNYLEFPVHEIEGTELLKNLDLLLVMGSELDGMNTKNWLIPWPKEIVVVDIQPEKPCLNSGAKHSIRSNRIDKVVSEFLNAPLKEKWIDIPALNLKVRDRLTKSEKEADGIGFVNAIDGGWPQNEPIFCDMAISGYWVGVYGKNSRVRRTAYPVGWGTLGYALPASIGAAAAGMKPLVVCGDGGIAFALSEMATVTQENFPVTILLNDDGGYGMLRFDQQVMNHKEQGVDLFNPDWQKLAESFNFEFLESSQRTLEADLRKAYEKGKPTFILYRGKLYPPRSTSPRWREN
jgi:thiamine pyrophosphate-dependent acetolactate synthase large subunit-like protein